MKDLQEDATSIFAEFQTKEYERIGEAHFKALEAISIFFRYYLIVMSLPLPMMAVLFGFVARSSAPDKAGVALLGVAAPFLVGVGIVGSCIAFYITNLKMDAVLYARVVNSIRKFFYDNYEADHANKLLMRQLPQSAYVPSYQDLWFGGVITALAMFNALYFFVGLHLVYLCFVKKVSSLDQLGFGGYSGLEIALLCGSALAVAGAHFGVYRLIVRHREYGYLKNNAIGVDIDGVLNMHREKFCELLKSKLGKSIKADQIKVLPVSDNLDLRVTRSDEREIFNDPSYWTDMPELEGAADALRSIKTAFLLPVHVFTHRPWPDVQLKEESEITALRQKWRAASDDMAVRANVKACVRAWGYLVTRCDYRKSIKFITRYWLRKHGFAFDSLLVERGNENIVYNRGRFENRFNYARKKKIRFFVEDDWTKAIKLSYICDVVFLIDHPYNRGKPKEVLVHANASIIGKLPTNVIRVKSWGELKKIIGQLV